VLAPKGPAPSGHHPDDRVGLAGHPKVPGWQVPGEVPRLLQGVQPAGAVALGGGTVRVPGVPAPEGPALGVAARFGAPGRPDIAGVPPAGEPIPCDAPDAIAAPGPDHQLGQAGLGVAHAGVSSGCRGGSGSGTTTGWSSSGRISNSCWSSPMCMASSFGCLLGACRRIPHWADGLSIDPQPRSRVKGCWGEQGLAGESLCQACWARCGATSPSLVGCLLTICPRL
jgi:hypothetical protein